MRDILELAMELSRNGKLDSLAHEQCLSAKHMEATGLTVALVLGNTATMGAYVGWILDRSSSVLSSEKRVELLLGSGKNGMPGLHLTAAADPSEDTARAVESVFSYMHAIAASRNLSAQAKATLCAAAFEGQTAAQAALAEKNPTVAAAMVCAIFEGESDPATRNSLLASLGVTPREVLATLDGQSYPKLADWIAVAEGAA